MYTPSLYPLNNDRHFDRGGLLDIPSAKRRMNEIKLSLEKENYGYQIPAQSRSASGQMYIDNRKFHSLSSYDYLGLIGNPNIEAAAYEAIRTFGTGTSGTRVLTGTNQLHLQLEHAIARFIGVEASMTVTSGYVANLTPLTALFGPNDLIVSDEFNHRSLLEAFKLTGMEVQFFAHNDMVALEMILKNQPAERRKIIISEGIFSMEGDRCPLPELVRLKQEYGAFLMIDEAHSLGVNGATGRGIHEHFGIPASSVDLWTGSLSKTIPSNGGYIAGDASLILYLQHAGLPYIFSSALSPMATGVALKAIETIESEPERVERLRNNSHLLINGLQQLGCDTGVTESAVVPVMMGDVATTHTMALELYKRGYHATAVTYPAVPVGKSRLRLCARADMDQVQIENVLAAFSELTHWIPSQSRASLSEFEVCTGGFRALARRA
ncbi:MAG: aminotransferase class I/II-fold pyridoxal phosphate-dependent enzyme [Saprospiraceae bacterium]